MWRDAELFTSGYILPGRINALVEHVKARHKFASGTRLNSIALVREEAHDCAVRLSRFGLLTLLTSESGLLSVPE
jgi:hypothetical protein